MIENCFHAFKGFFNKTFQTSEPKKILPSCIIFNHYQQQSNLFDNLYGKSFYILKHVANTTLYST